MMNLRLIHISGIKELEIYQVFGLMNLNVQGPRIEWLTSFKKIKLFQYCYVERMKIFMNS